MIGRRAGPRPRRGGQRRAVAACRRRRSARRCCAGRRRRRRRSARTSRRRAAGVRRGDDDAHACGRRRRAPSSNVAPVAPGCRAAAAVGVAALPLVGEGDVRRAGPRPRVGGQRAAVARGAVDRRRSTCCPGGAAPTAVVGADCAVAVPPSLRAVTDDAELRGRRRRGVAVYDLAVAPAMSARSSRRPRRSAATGSRTRSGPCRSTVPRSAVSVSPSRGVPLIVGAPLLTGRPRRRCRPRPRSRSPCRPRWCAVTSTRSVPPTSVAGERIGAVGRARDVRAARRRSASQRRHC